MADISHVTHAIRNKVAAALYPNGVPSNGVSPVINGRVRVFVGWPDHSLDTDLAAGITQVTIWPRGTVSNLGPYLSGWQENPRQAPTMTVSVGEDSVTFAGNASAPRMIAAITVGEGVAATKRIEAGDTPESVTAALAALLAPSWPGAEAQGPSVILPLAHRLRGRVVIGGTATRELRRVRQGVAIAIWAPSAALRDAAAQAIDAALMAPEQRRLLLADGTSAFLSYEGTGFDEEARKAPLHRRDIYVSAEFAAVQTQEADAVAVVDVPVEPTNAPVRRVVF